MKHDAHHGEGRQSRLSPAARSATSCTMSASGRLPNQAVAASFHGWATWPPGSVFDVDRYLGSSGQIAELMTSVATGAKVSRSD